MYQFYVQPYIADQMRCKTLDCLSLSLVERAQVSIPLISDSLTLQFAIYNTANIQGENILFPKHEQKPRQTEYIDVIEKFWMKLDRQ